MVLGTLAKKLSIDRESREERRENALREKSIADNEAYDLEREKLRVNAILSQVPQTNNTRLAYNIPSEMLGTFSFDCFEIGRGINLDSIRVERGLLIITGCDGGDLMEVAIKETTHIIPEGVANPKRVIHMKGFGKTLRIAGKGDEYFYVPQGVEITWE